MPKKKEKKKGFSLNRPSDADYFTLYAPPSVFLDCRDTPTLPLSNVKGKLMELVRKWWSDSSCCLCTWVCVLQHRIDMRSAPLFICALRVSTEIGVDWGQKHSPAISPPTTCFLPVYCATRSLWTFPLTSPSLHYHTSIASWLSQGKALHHGVFEKCTDLSDADVCFS